MPPQLETNRTELLEARIQITSPKAGIVQPSFKLQGTASVRMRETEFVKVSGQGKTTETEFLVSKGFKVKVSTGGLQTDATVKVQNDGSLHWSHAVTGVSGQRFDFTVRLLGNVQETFSKSVNGKEEEATVKTKGVNRMAEVKVRVDPDAPELHASLLQVSKGPPYLATIVGATKDASKELEVRAEFEGAITPARSVSGSFATWIVDVPIPGLDVERTVRIVAEDKAGNRSQADVTIGSDKTAPAVAISNPQSNPHLPTFQDGGITVLVEGITGDLQSKVAAVQWQLDSGPINEADDVGGNFAFWRLEAPIDTPAVQFLKVTAVDAAGNASKPAVLEIRPVFA
jgi:hypothetical protein